MVWRLQVVWHTLLGAVVHLRNKSAIASDSRSRERWARPDLEVSNGVRDYRSAACDGRNHQRA